MVVDADNTTPISVTRWYSEKAVAEVKRYETVSMDFAVYSPSSSTIEAIVVEYKNNTTKYKQKVTAQRNKTYTYTQRVTDTIIDGSVRFDLYVSVSGKISQSASFKVLGTLLDIEAVSAQLMFDMDMASRSNSDADKTITDNGYTLSVKGSNYSTNGFVKDSYGTEQYGTENDEGVMALRIAENVTASLNYMPFNQASIESNGLAIQFRIKAKHIAMMMQG